MARHKDAIWDLPDAVTAWDQVAAALLMDIRDELRRLNATLDCGSARSIPVTLREISSRLHLVVEHTRPRRRRTKR